MRNPIKLFYADYGQNELGKEVVHLVMFCISAFLSVNLFWQISSELFPSILLATIAVILEYTKIQAFMYTKYYMTHFKVRRVFTLVPAVLTFSAYLVMALISGMGTWGFAQVSVANQSNYSDRQNSEAVFIQNRIDTIDEELDILADTMKSANEEKKKLNTLEHSYQTGQSMMTDDILRLGESRRKLLDEKMRLAKQLQSSESEQIRADDIFNLIGETPFINMSGNEVKFYLFMMIVFITEFVLCMTSGSRGGKTDVGNVRKRNLLKYIEGLFDTDRNRLNSDKRISEKTGLDISDCKKYRKYLSNKEFGGLSLLNYGRGFSKSDFTKDEVLAIIRDE